MIARTNRVDWVDYAKGICIILVVMMHTVYGIEGALGGQGWMHPIVDFARPFRMPDFFLISGLFLSRTLNGPADAYYDRKLVHFIYFYLLWLTIQLGAIEAELLLQSPLAFAEMWLMALIEPLNSLWFVHMLAIFYVVCRLLRKVPVLIVMAGAIALQTAYQFDLINTGWNVIDRFANRFVYFYFGYAAAPAVFAFAARVPRHTLIFLGGLVVWGFANWYMVQRDHHNAPFWSLMLGLAGATAVCIVSALLDNRDWLKSLRYAGKHSIVIYLSFVFPLKAMEKLLPRFAPEDFSVGWACALTLALAVVVPLIFHAIIRGIPLRILYERPIWFALPGQTPRGTRKAALENAPR